MSSTKVRNRATRPPGLACLILSPGYNLSGDMKYDKNPIYWVKETLGLTWAEMAYLFNTNLTTIVYYGHGLSVSLADSIVEKLKELGYPGDPRKDYEEFRAERAREVSQFAKERLDWKEWKQWKGRKARSS